MNCHAVNEDQQNDMPDAAPVIPENIPESLRRRPQWVCWDYSRRDGRWLQLPIMPFGMGWPARVDKPRSWSSFATALAYHQSHGTAGVGFVLCGTNGLVGVTLKRAFDPDFQTVEPWAAELLGQLNTYCEVSPDGADVKAFVVGRLPRDGMMTDPGRAGRVGLYSSGRYLTITGQMLAEYPAEVAGNQRAIDELVASYFSPTARPRNP